MRRRVETELETPITTMIDIVFLLLIFFVVTYREGAEQEEDKSIHLAKGRYAVADGKKEGLTLNLHKDGRISCNGEAVLPEGLGSLLENRASLLLRSDAEVPFSRIRTVLLAAARNGVRRVRLVVEVSEENKEG